MVELEDLPNVGEKTAQKLRDAGFADMMRLATSTAKELSVKVEIGEGVAEKVIEAARKAEQIDFETVSTSCQGCSRVSPLRVIQLC